MLSLEGKEFTDKEFFDATYQKYIAIYDKKDHALQQAIKSSALGAEHEYEMYPESGKINLSLLLNGGQGGWFSCIDSDGVKDRRLHTHQQLQRICYDGEMVIQGIMAEYYANRKLIFAANSIEELNAIII